METSVIQSEAMGNARLLSVLARKRDVPSKKKKERVQTCLEIESAWAKDWLTPEEDEAWKDL